MNTKVKIITASVVTLFLIPALSLAYNGYCNGPGYGGRGPFHMWGPGGFFGGGIFMMIITTLITGVLIFFAVQYFRNNKTSSVDEALTIARKRFANGEITKDEFETIKSNL